MAIGFAPIFVRLSEVGPVSTAFWRLVLALPALWGLRRDGNPADAFRRQPAALCPANGGKRAADLRKMMVAAGLLFAGDLAFWHWSIRFTSVANSTLLANFAPIFVVLFGWLGFPAAGEPAVHARDARRARGHDPARGQRFPIAAARVVRRCARVDHGGFLRGLPSGHQEFAASAARRSRSWRAAAVTAAALLPVALISGERLLPHAAGWGLLVALALFSHVGGQSLIAYALAKLPAAVASVSLLVQPVTATAAAAVLLREPSRAAAARRGAGAGGSVRRAAGKPLKTGCVLAAPPGVGKAAG